MTNQPNYFTKDFGVKATPQLTPESYSQRNKPLPAGVVDMKGTQNKNTNPSQLPQPPAQRDTNQSPYAHANITPSNWRTPGAVYNDLDTAQLLTREGSVWLKVTEQVNDLVRLINDIDSNIHLLGK